MLATIAAGVIYSRLVPLKPLYIGKRCGARKKSDFMRVIAGFSAATEIEIPSRGVTDPLFSASIVDATALLRGARLQGRSVILTQCQHGGPVTLQTGRSSVQPRCENSAGPIPRCGLLTKSRGPAAC